MSLGGSTFEPVDLAVANVTCFSSFVKSSTDALDSWLLPAFPPLLLVSRYVHEQPVHRTLTTIEAGNWAEDAEFFSPARTPSAITVAASDIYDTLAYFSNYGTHVDIIAPG